jgi:hypothetical protein
MRAGAGDLRRPTLKARTEHTSPSTFKRVNSGGMCCSGCCEGEAVEACETPPCDYKVGSALKQQRKPVS